MGTIEKLNLGIVGAAGRGGSFKQSCDALDFIRIHAVCDINPEGLDQAAISLGATERYLDYESMLEHSEIDAVIIGTPMQWHVSQAIAALERNIHVLSEVPAAVSPEECMLLVQASRNSSATYMMAENYTYTRSNQIVKELVRHGLLGNPYYAEGEYLHELKGLNEITKWRRTWQTGINGITYGTHSLGPILQWMPGDRVVRVCCAGSGHNYLDPGGNKYENEDSCVMLCQMRSGGLVKIRVDMISDRPHAGMNYQLQGTDGCYESARAPGEKDRIWLRSHGRSQQTPEGDESASMTWVELEDLANEFTPGSWRVYEEMADRTGHGGGDLLELVDFVDAVRQHTAPVIGIHEAMDMTLPGLLSQQSIANGGRWIDVPDSRNW